MSTQDHLVIAGREFRSRLLTGTGKYDTFETMREALGASGSEVVTVAVRRVDLDPAGLRPPPRAGPGPAYHVPPPHGAGGGG